MTDATLAKMKRDGDRVREEDRRAELCEPLFKKYGPRWRYCTQIRCFTGDVLYTVRASFGRIISWEEE